MYPNFLEKGPPRIFPLIHPRRPARYPHAAKTQIYVRGVFAAGVRADPAALYLAQWPMCRGTATHLSLPGGSQLLQPPPCAATAGWLGHRVGQLNVWGSGQARKAPALLY